jgi:hypothetical protein
MAKFRSGLEIEDRLKTILERIGCVITEDTDLDHAWKIDFVVTRFPQIPSIFALGVQVTARIDDLPKLEEFLRIHQYNRIAEKVIYLEFDKYADLDKGGGFAAFAAMMDYRLNTHWRNTPIMGVRINNDLSITSFNLQDRISELRRRSHAPQQSQPSSRPHTSHQDHRHPQRRPDAPALSAASESSSQAAPSLPEPASPAANATPHDKTPASSRKPRSSEPEEAESTATSASVPAKKSRRRRPSGNR